MKEIRFTCPLFRICYVEFWTKWYVFSATIFVDITQPISYFQVCPLVIGSFGYSAEDIVYQWKKPKAVAIDKLGLAQFHLVDYKATEEFEIIRRTRSGFRNDSLASLEFFFERQRYHYSVLTDFKIHCRVSFKSRDNLCQQCAYTPANFAKRRQRLSGILFA